MELFSRNRTGITTRIHTTTHARTHTHVHTRASHAHPRTHAQTHAHAHMRNKSYFTIWGENKLALIGKLILYEKLIIKKSQMTIFKSNTKNNSIRNI